MSTPTLNTYVAPVMPQQPTNQFWQQQLKRVDQSSRSITEYLNKLNLLTNAANDAAAAAAGVLVGAMYRNGSVLMVRVT